MTKVFAIGLAVTLVVATVISITTSNFVILIAVWAVIGPMVGAMAVHYFGGRRRLSSETSYLLSSPANARRLARSLRQAKGGNAREDGV